MSEVYKYPLYYEIAFSFRDIEAEVNVMVQCMQRFSKIPIKTILELGCGNCPHTLELCERGYRYIGIDKSHEMIEFSKRKLKTFHDQSKLICADMNSFKLNDKVEFVLIQVGSLFVSNESDIQNHFDSVANVLQPGGLYFLDGCIEFGENRDDITWQLERNGIKVKTKVVWGPINRAKQIFNERITLEVDDNGDKLFLKSNYIRRAIYPQEFLHIVNCHPSFEFIGWWHLWDLKQPLDEVESPDRAIALIRRT